MSFGRILLSQRQKIPGFRCIGSYYGLPDEVQMLREMTRTFAEQELVPIAGKTDKAGVLPSMSHI